MWVKGTLLLIFALFIDGLQAMIGLGVSTIALFPGTAAGAVGGCLVATKVVSGSVSCAIGGFVLGALGSFPIINGVLATVTVPLGIILIFAINVCISITMGAGLIAMLWVTGMFYPGYITGVFIGEAMPGFDVVPGWTFLVVRSIMKKNAESGAGIVGVASGIASAMISPGGSTIKNTFGAAKSAPPSVRSTATAANDNEPKTEQRTPNTLQTKNFDGIKPYVPKAA